MVLIPEEIIPARRKCDKHKNPKACEGEVKPRIVDISTDTATMAPDLDGDWHIDLCDKAYIELHAVIQTAITPRTRKSKKAEATA